MTRLLTSSEVEAINKRNRAARIVPSQSKYHNIKTVVNGKSFASKKEARRYEELLLLERAGKIFNLELQPAYPCVINGIRVCTYLGDFRYVENGKTICEDTKGYKTDIYRLKKKLVFACCGVTVKEV